MLYLPKGSARALQASVTECRAHTNTHTHMRIKHVHKRAMPCMLCHARVRSPCLHTRAECAISFYVCTDGMHACALCLPTCCAWQGMRACVRTSMLCMLHAIQAFAHSRNFHCGDEGFSHRKYGNWVMPKSRCGLAHQTIRSESIAS